MIIVSSNSYGGGGGGGSSSSSSSSNLRELILVFTMYCVLIHFNRRYLYS